MDRFEVSDDPRHALAQSAVLARLRALAEAIRFDRARIPNLVFYGPVGTGKDFLLASMLRVAVSAGVSVALTRGIDLAAQFRDAMHSNAEDGHQAIVYRYSEPRILAISDILPTAGALSPFQTDSLFSIVDRRYEAMRPVWVTMNASSRAEAIERMGAQLNDRLRDGAVIIACEWASYRKPLDAKS